MIEIPKGNMDDNDPTPCWVPCVDREGNHLKPVIRCKCGMYCGIGLHHVHADGTVTASFWHAREGEHPQGTRDGCGWHVHLKLLGYDNWGDFPPGS